MNSIKSNIVVQDEPLYRSSTPTLNYVFKTIADNKIGQSIILDDGTSVGISQATPTAKLHITSPAFSPTSFGLKLDTSGGLPLLYSKTTAAGGVIGIGISPAFGSTTKLHIVSTTEQLRLGYDASNYIQTTVGSTGTATINSVGTASNIILSRAGSNVFEATLAGSTFVGNANTGTLGTTIVGNGNGASGGIGNYNTIVGYTNGTNAMLTGASNVTRVGNSNNTVGGGIDGGMKWGSDSVIIGGHSFSGTVYNGGSGNIIIGGLSGTASNAVGSNNVMIGNYTNACDNILGNNSIVIGDGSGNIRMSFDSSGVPKLTGVPTSSAGLTSGQIWSNLGILTIVP